MPISPKVRDVMDQNVVSVDAKSPVTEIITKMIDSNVWSVLVQNEQKKPVGVVTERDIIRRALAKHLQLDAATADEIMTKPLITIKPDASLGEAMELMSQMKVRRLFVVESDRIVGRITQTELFDNSLSIMISLSSLRSQM